jgi:hypothetical protein
MRLIWFYPVFLKSIFRCRILVLELPMYCIPSAWLSWFGFSTLFNKPNIFRNLVMSWMFFSPSYDTWHQR